MRKSERLRRILRFGVVGVVNTAVDFGLLFLLTRIGLPVLVANVISTSVALGLSFVLNRAFAFRSRGGGGVQLLLFLLVTLFGLWVLQPVVIFGVSALMVTRPAWELLVGKVAATVVSMTWNYLLYATVVFRHRPAGVEDPRGDSAVTTPR